MTTTADRAKTMEDYWDTDINKRIRLDICGLDVQKCGETVEIVAHDGMMMSV
jgi:hypothetical protein